MEAIRAKGPDVSIDQIAEAAGVSKPVFYAEFGDKNGLVDAMAVALADEVEHTVVARVARVAAGGEVRPDLVIEAVIEDEPALYPYIVRSIRMRDRGLLDNALVRVIHARSALIVGHLADDLLPGELKVLTDGIFGFAFGVIESWVAAAQGGGPPADATITKEQLIETTTVMVRGGLTALAAQRARPGSG
jgi:AcrR family transcriptional regulator